MAKKNPRPDVLKSGDYWYQLVVFRVVTKDERGRPEECVLIPDDRVVELAHNGGDEFMTAYVPKVMMKGGA